MALDKIHVANRIKPTKAQAIADLIQPRLNRGESIAGIFQISSLKPLLDTVVVTNKRLLACNTALGMADIEMKDELAGGDLESVDLRPHLNFRKA